jgi:hypothetical protein
MEQGAKTLLRILVASVLVGAAMIALMPSYRQTALAIWRGVPETAPIWKSNVGYYAEISLETAAAHADPQ